MTQEFIRNVSSRYGMDPNGHVHATAFKKLKDENALSLLERDESLATDEALETLQRDSILTPSNDLPGFCFLNEEQLAVVGFGVKAFHDPKCPRPHLHRLLKKLACDCEPEQECPQKGCGLPSNSQRDTLGGLATVNNHGRKVWYIVQGFGEL